MDFNMGIGQHPHPEHMNGDEEKLFNSFIGSDLYLVIAPLREQGYAFVYEMDDYITRAQVHHEKVLEVRYNLHSIVTKFTDVTELVNAGKYNAKGLGKYSVLFMLRKSLV